MTPEYGDSQDLKYSHGLGVDEMCTFHLHHACYISTLLIPLTLPKII